MIFLRKNISGIALAASVMVVLLYLLGAKEKDDASGRNAIVINEVCTSNLASLYDENGEHPDWIELYNRSSESVDISGWKLSDSHKRRDKWEFPEGTGISANGYLIVYADGTEKKKPDADQSFSVESFIMNGEAIATESTGLHTSFELSDKGEQLILSDKGLTVADIVEVPNLKYDTSWARARDGENGFSRLTPSPNQSNSLGKNAVYPTLKKPEFSAESGFYDEAFDLEISSDEGEVHYTLDGSMPTADSPTVNGSIHISDASSQENVYSAMKETSVELLDYIKYKFEIPKDNVDKCTVVRAAVFDDAGNISETATKSYFVGFNKKDEYDDLGFISLVSDSEGLFGYENGIYVIGENGVEDFKKRVYSNTQAMQYLTEHPNTPLDGSVSICGVKMGEYMDSNYWRKGTSWEREACLTVFDKDHTLDSEQEIGIRVKGHRTRNFPKKSLNLYARDIYGKDSFSTSFFGDKESDLTLFSGGNDLLSLLKDELVADLTDGLDFGSLKFTKPYAVFLDGEFWGLYRISEKFDREYIEKVFGVDDDEVIIAKNGMFSDGESGDEEIFGDFESFINHADFTSGTDYERFKSQVDMDSLIDYYAVRVYVDEAMDWPNINTGMWRSREDKGSSEYNDGRWRWFNFDNNSNLDYGAVSANSINKAMNGTKNYSRDEMLYKLMQNEEFKKEFRERFEWIAAEVFDADKAIERLDVLAKEVRPYIELEYKRYYGDKYTLESFDNEIENMRKYFRERADYIIPYVEELCR